MCNQITHPHPSRFLSCCTILFCTKQSSWDQSYVLRKYQKWVQWRKLVYMEMKDWNWQYSYTNTFLVRPLNQYGHGSGSSAGDLEKNAALIFSCMSFMTAYCSLSRHFLTMWFWTCLSDRALNVCQLASHRRGCWGHTWICTCRSGIWKTQTCWPCQQDPSIRCAELC